MVNTSNRGTACWLPTTNINLDDIVYLAEALGRIRILYLEGELLSQRDNRDEINKLFVYARHGFYVDGYSLERLRE